MFRNVSPKAAEFLDLYYVKSVKYPKFQVHRNLLENMKHCRHGSNALQLREVECHHHCEPRCAGVIITIINQIIIIMHERNNTTKRIMQ